MNDSFSSLLSDPADKVKLLQDLLSGTVETIMAMDQFHDDQPDSVVIAAKSVKLLCQAFLALLVPTDGYMDSGIAQVSAVRAYKGKDSALQTASKLLTAEFWQVRRDEMLKKAGTSKVGAPKLAAALAKFDEKSPDYNKFAGVEEAVRILPELRQGMRAGATRDLEEAMRGLLDHSIEEVLKSSGSEQKPAWLQSLSSAGILVGTPKQQQELEEWKNKFSHAQAGQAVAEEAEAICMLDDQSLSSLDLTKLGKAFAKCPSTGPLPSEVADVVKKAVPKIIRHLKLKDRCSFIETSELSALIYIALLYLYIKLLD